MALESITVDEPKKPHILVGVTGSVAAIKIPQLCALLCKFATVKVVATGSARHFFSGTVLPQEALPVLGDDEEWHQWNQVGDPVLHIDLRRWADLFVIAPLSANSLAKISSGICDNLLTCIVRAWDFKSPLLVAPAMNTFMWDSPFTSRQLAAIEEFGVRVIPPVSKKLACGDIGTGAMASPEDIARACAEALHCGGSAQLEHLNKADQPGCFEGVTSAARTDG